MIRKDGRFGRGRECLGSDNRARSWGDGRAHFKARWGREC
jgi:hypothetical protein